MEMKLPDKTAVVADLLVLVSNVLTISVFARHSNANWKSSLVVSLSNTAFKR